MINPLCDNHAVRPAAAARHAAAAAAPAPRSCDTFVALPPATADGSVVFGKNSDRQDEEVQEVVSYPGGEHPAGTMLQCTYISIPQAPRTFDVVLSKPSWMWGAEMGANSRGVVCGNEAVWTVEESDGPPALLGMDLVRLALERGGSASEALSVITSLLEAHGQGGACEEGGDWTYHNSFLIADAADAWVLETAGRWWVAQRITAGVRNISNCLSVRTAFDRCSSGLREHARRRGYWDGQGELDWAAAFSDGGAPPLGQLTPGREANGRKLLERAAAAGGLTPAAMMGILRDRGSGICMCGGGFRSNGSQVSRLVPQAADGPGSSGDGGGSDGGSGCDSTASAATQHWFTGTPDPQRSVFKPFLFARAAGGRPLDGSPHTAAAPAPRNPPHALWLAWQAAHEGRRSGSGGGGGKRPSQAELRELEVRGLEPGGGLSWAAAVEEELRLYGQA